MEQNIEILGIPIITATVYEIIAICKKRIPCTGNLKYLYPLSAGIFGGILGAVLYLLSPSLMGTSTAWSAVLTGAAAGLSATGADQLLRKTVRFFSQKTKKDARVFITGDKHGDFSSIRRFCRENETIADDIMVILGDSGFNTADTEESEKVKEDVSDIPITFFCVYGNADERPEKLPSYQSKDFHGATVLYEPNHPNILFACDGEVYDILGKKALVIGGACSSECHEDEEPNCDIREKTEYELLMHNSKIDWFFTHTVPIDYIPDDVKAKCNRPRETEKWLGTLEKTVSYSNWYAGHYHRDTTRDRVSILYNSIVELKGEAL